jgi:hypothetical protein
MCTFVVDVLGQTLVPKFGNSPLLSWVSSFIPGYETALFTFYEQGLKIHTPMQTLYLGKELPTQDKKLPT